MQQDTTVISSYSVNDVWPQSYIALTEVESFSRPPAPAFIDSIANFGLILAIALFFLFAYNRIIDGLYYVLTSFMSLKKMLIIENQSNTKTSRNTLLLFSIICSSFIVVNYNVENRFIENDYPIIINFLLVLFVAGGYFLFRRVACSLLAWVNSNGIFITVDQIYYSYSVLWILLSIVWFILYIVFPNLDLPQTAFYIIISVLLFFGLYVIRGYQLIIANGFSHFFYILYLCTLEILPVLILVHLIFK